MSPTGMPAVVVEGLGKRFRLTRDRRTTIKERIVRGRATHVDEFWALRDVSLSVPTGSVYGLIGHNGSGKSTLLKCIGGIYRPTSGSVRAEGRIASLIELGAGFHPDMTGRENIRLNGSILGLPRREVERATDEIIDFSGIGDFIDEPVKTYSSGMHVRLGFSVAVHMRPDVLLVDEVIAVGDEDFQRKCFDHLYSLRRAGRTIIVVSHSTGLISSLCDEASWLDRGRLALTGSAPVVVDAYLASVNAAEIEAASREESLPSEEVVERSGSGEVRLRSVELLAADGSAIPSCTAGKQLRIRIALKSAAPVEDPILSLSFRHESGPVVCITDTRLAGAGIGVLEGSGWVDYVQDTCWLNPGHYRVDATIQDSTGTKVFDEWVDAADLVVRPGAGPARGGLVNLPGAFVRDEFGGARHVASRDRKIP